MMKLLSPVKTFKFTDKFSKVPITYTPYVYYEEGRYGVCGVPRDMPIHGGDLSFKDRTQLIRSTFTVVQYPWDCCGMAVINGVQAFNKTDQQEELTALFFHALHNQYIVGTGITFTSIVATQVPETLEYYLNFYKKYMPEYNVDVVVQSSNARYNKYDANVLNMLYIYPKDAKMSRYNKQHLPKYEARQL